MFECQNSRKIDRSHIPDVTPEEAWDLLTKAISERDIDDVKDALDRYLKHFPEMTYVDLHNAFRAQGLNMWLIATERQLVHTYTNMDLQGNIGKRFSVSYRFSDKPERPREAASWPATPEEMVARLQDAGEVVDSGVRKCGNCDGVGHRTKDCPEERQPRDRIVVMCYNCNESGHRIRDCKSDSILPTNSSAPVANCSRPQGSCRQVCLQELWEA